MRRPRFETNIELMVDYPLTVHPEANWVPGGNTGEIKAARKGTGHPTSQSRWLSTSVSLTGTPQRTDRIWDIPLPLLRQEQSIIEFLLSLLLLLPFSCVCITFTFF